MISILFYLLILLDLLSALTNSTRIVDELELWKEDRYIDCIFCIDYDNFRRISIFGCNSPSPLTCRGNVCFMRQHKSQQFFLYTSGCLNLTENEYIDIGRGMRDADIQSGGRGEETLLCEVSRKMNTCLCSDEQKCNNMSITAPFSEYHSSTMLGAIDFHELLHFRYFLPSEPVLRNLDVAKLDDILRTHYVPDYKSSSSSCSIFPILIYFLLFIC